MILEYVSRCSKITESIKDNVSRISQSNKNFNSYLIASDYLKNNRMIFVVLPRLFEAQEYYDTLINLLDEKDVLFYPVDDFSLANNYVSSKEFKYERINTLINLLNNETKIIVTNVSGLLRNNLSKKEALDRLHLQDEGDRADFIIENNSDINELKTKIEKLIKELNI